MAIANNTTLLKYSLKTNIVKSIYFDIISRVSRYYYTYGRTQDWPTVNAIDEEGVPYVASSEEVPPSAVDSYSYELETRRNMLYMKQVDANDSALVVRRLNYVPGVTYDMYDDYSVENPSYNGATSIDQANFYVLTSDYNVYKCLFNNNDGASGFQPTGTSTEPVQLEDGYIWKFMYTVPLSLRNKFLTTSYMPVTTSLASQFYSNGSIVSYSIENKGSQYIKNSWSVGSIQILDGGVDYDINDITITFPAPDISGGVQAVADVTGVSFDGTITEITITTAGSGYSTQPIPTVTSTVGTGFVYTVEYTKDDEAYTILKVSGDGYNENNPYSLKTITILDRGVFDEVPSGDLFTFPSATLKYGRFPSATVTFRTIVGSSPTQYEVDTITVTDQGYGYESPLVFGQNVFAGPLTANSSGFSCDLNVSTQKNEAELIPLINANGEIEAIQIVNPGLGYTYANVTVESKKMVLFIPEDPGSGVLTDLSAANTPGFIPAVIRLNFGIGDAETKQSNVELLAVDGAIPVVKVDFGGDGYPANSTVTIVGDGTGCTCVPVIEAGKIKKINVTNPGSGYSYATATISGGGSGAIARPIISPFGGHGKDAVSELYANTLMLVSILSSEKNQGILASNDYRQICILKNPKEYEASNYFRKAIGSTCVLIEIDITSDNTIAYSNIAVDTVLYLAGNSSKSFRVVEKSAGVDKYYMLLQVNDNFVPVAGASLYSGQYTVIVSSVTSPDVNKYSGELLYIDNRIKFASTDEQSIVTSTLISF